MFVKASKAVSRLGGRSQVLLIAIVIHLCLALSIYLIARLSLFPDVVDQHGIIVPLAQDSVEYLNDIDSLVGLLYSKDVGGWATALAPLHVKIHSLSFAVLAPVFGLTIVSAEPVNIFLYCAILVLLYQIGVEVADGRVGLLASLGVAVWPSFLLHTTQLLKDPLFIAATLSIVLVVVKWLTGTSSLLKGVVAGSAGGAVSAIIWLVRYDSWSLIVGIVALGATLLVIRQISERRILIGNMVSAGLLLTCIGSVPMIVLKFQVPDAFLPSPYEETLIAEKGLGRITPPEELAADEKGKQPRSMWSRLQSRLDSFTASLDERRQWFGAVYPDAGSNLDVNVRFLSFWDVIRYLPRAALVGLFAPFPNMWIGAGTQVGLTGKLLSGFETIVMYVVQLLALLGLWNARQRLASWFLILTSIAGATALGLIILNIGAMYRLRYVFWMLIVILGAQGATLGLTAILHRKRAGARHSLSAG